jgi:hypothetical protein
MNNLDNSTDRIDNSFEELYASYNHLLKQYERERDYNNILVSILKHHKIGVPPFETPCEIDF